MDRDRRGLIERTVNTHGEIDLRKVFVPRTELEEGWVGTVQQYSRIFTIS